MKKEFTMGWLALVLYFCVVELLAPFDSWRLAGVIMFAALEIYALGRPGPFDTFSEHVWAYIKGKPARIVLVVGFTLYLGVVLLNIVAATDLMLGSVPVAPLVLVTTFIAWALPHFLTEGRLG